MKRLILGVIFLLCIPKLIIAGQYTQQGPLSYSEGWPDNCYWRVSTWDILARQYHSDRWDVVSDFMGQNIGSISSKVINKADPRITIKVSCRAGLFIVERTW
jgi:hypothetical protein